MKKLIALIVLMSGLAVTGQAETKTLIVQRNTSKELEIKSGQVVTVLSWQPKFMGLSNPRGKIVITVGDDIVELYGQYDVGTIVVSGPAKLSLEANGSNPLMVTFKIEDDSGAGDGNNVTVIPDSTDNATLVLEGSDDMVNWTVETLGEKPKGNRKKFYRLRAVKE